MKYTVIIPTYNAAKYVGEAVDSILGQTVPPEKIIVSDDGSTDDLTGALENRPVHVLHHANTGPGGATNRGIALVETEVLATLDADDIWVPDKMEKQLDVLKRNPEVHGVFAKLKSFHQDEVVASIDDEKSGWSRTTMTIYTSAFRSVGDIEDTAAKCAEMVDWIDRARFDGLNLHMLDEFLAFRRLHAESLTYNRGAEGNKAYLEIARRAILRRKT